MRKLMIVGVALAFAGTASAAGWKSLRLDASSDAAFEQSLAEFKDALSPGRRYVLGEILKDIRDAGAQRAVAEGRDYSTGDYYRQIDGLTYEELVALVDPTGKIAKRYRAAYNPYVAGDRGIYRASIPAPPNPWIGAALAPQRESGPNWRGGTPLHGPTFPQN